MSFHLIFCGGIPSLSKSNIEKIEVLIPSKAEQQKIAACLSALDARIAAETDQLTALKAHKKAAVSHLEIFRIRMLMI
jgi:type I restriction enzyme, S subunit